MGHWKLAKETQMERKLLKHFNRFGTIYSKKKETQFQRSYHLLIKIYKCILFNLQLLRVFICNIF